MVAGLWLYAAYGEVLLWMISKKHNVQSTVVPPNRNSTRFRGFHHKSSSALTITFFLLFHSEVLYIFWQCGSFASLDIVLIQKKRGKKSFPVLFSCLIIDRTLCSTNNLIDVFVLFWWKPKWVHLDVICKHKVVFLLKSVSVFWNRVGFEKEEKKWHTQAFQFLQLVVHMYFVPVKLFILEIKEKKNLYWKKIVWPLNVASPWPGLEFGLLGGVKQFFCH